MATATMLKNHILSSLTLNLEVNLELFGRNKLSIWFEKMNIAKCEVEQKVKFL